jgi:hypothetical protein
MNFHYYPPFWQAWAPYGEGVIGKASYVRQMLREYGYEGKPVICTEAGWTGTGEWGNDELQSRYTVKLYTRSFAADLDVVIWYRMADGASLESPGLLDPDNQPKDSYHAYQLMTELLGGSLYQRPLAVSSPLEGYVFERRSGRMDVVWTNDATYEDGTDDPVVPYTASASSLQVIDKYGNETLVTDAQDGTVDGQVTVEVGGSPLYLIYNQ